MTKNLTSQSLQILLARFSADERQSAAAYTALRASLVRFFEFKGDSEPEAAADATLDRTAEKIARNTPIDDVKKYSFGVARLIYLERMRAAQKEKKAAESFYQARTESANDVEIDDFQFLRECFKNLPTADQTLLQNYFTDAPYQKIIETRRLMVDERGVSINQMRVKISRLRKSLENCVQIKRKIN